ncbi:MAG: hypothetical protein AB7H48_09095 [Parachlamydiales bacterium]
MQTPTPIIETPAQEETDCDLIKNLAGAAAFGVGILVTAGGVLMMLREGGAPRDLPTLAGHVTVGGGHFHFAEAVQRITETIPQIRSSVSDALTSSRVVPLDTRGVPQARDQISLVVDDGWSPVDSRPEYTHRGTWHREDPSSRWEGSLEQERFREGLERLQEGIEELNENVGDARVAAIQERIEELRRELDSLNEKQASTLMEGIWATMKGVCPFLDVMEGMIDNLKEGYSKFLEFGDNGYRAGEIAQEIEQLMELERSLDAGREFGNTLSELRHN